MNIKSMTAHKSAAFLTPIRSGLLALALASGLHASAQTTTTSTNFLVGAPVPDDDASGLASAKIVSSPITYVTGLKVNLKLSGTFNGDMYVYLAHGGTNAVLLNRVGRSASSGLGYSDKGFDVVFDDASTNGDVHVYRTKLGGPISGPLTNSWAPDARRTNPTNVLTTDARTAFLSGFNGLNPNGEWVLFVADMEAGDLYTVNNWGLEITGYTPPSIVSGPANASAECSNDSPSFSVIANGSATLNYQWRFNASPIAGATSSTFTVNNATFANAGNYDVVITNNYGAITSAVASLTIQDTIPPVVDAETLAPVIAQCSAVLPAAPTATDACEGQIVGTPDQVGPFTQGDTTITWTFTDSHCNSSHQQQAVHVHDTTIPVITLLGSSTVTVECHGGYTDAGATANDNCDGNISSRIVTVNSVNANSPGTYTVTYNVSDTVGNPAVQVTRTVIVHDTLAPVPNVATLTDVTGQCSATVTPPTATDECAGVITATTSDPLTYTSQGDFVVHWTYSDGNGNTATQTQNVKVHDTTIPVVTCPANITVITTNTGGMAVTFAPTATDNCGVGSIVAAPASGSTFTIGTTPVTVTATDVNGNTSQCNFTVTVVLNHAPIAEDITMGAVANHSRNLLLEKVQAHCFDEDGDPMTVAVSSTSTNGGTVTLSAGAITYTPVANFVGTDSFTYTLDDGRGGTASAMVIVQVSSADALTPNITGGAMTGPNTFVVRFAGIPGFEYHIERTPSLSSPTWTDIGAITAPEDGQIEFTDSNAPVGSAYYRTAASMP